MRTHVIQTIIRGKQPQCNECEGWLVNRMASSILAGYAGEYSAWFCATCGCVFVVALFDERR